MTDAWAHFMVMDNMKRDGKPQTWIAKSRSLVMQRTITAIKGNQLTIDIPLTDALDNRFFTTSNLGASKPADFSFEGSQNLAIGCIGSREQTARLFDSSPILEEGFFESHGKPVYPQSLYLAQLADRLGQRAITKLGYTSNTLSQFNNKRVQPTPPLKTAPDQVLGTDLALHRPINSNQMRNNLRQFAGEKAVDAAPATYWATNDGSQPATLEIDMEGPVVINALLLSEVAGKEQVLEYKVEGQVDSDWTLLSQGTTIGSRKVDQFPAATVWKVRLTILKAKNYAAIQQVGLYYRK